MVIAGYEIPDRCPKGCPHRDSFAMYGQSAICGRCPLLVCTPDPSEGWCLVEPDDFRPDWAKAWSEWFKGDMQGQPDLLLVPSEGGDA